MSLLFSLSLANWTSQGKQIMTDGLRQPLQNKQTIFSHKECLTSSIGESDTSLRFQKPFPHYEAEPRRCGGGPESTCPPEAGYWAASSHALFSRGEGAMCVLTGCVRGTAWETGLACYTGPRLLSPHACKPVPDLRTTQVRELHPGIDHQLEALAAILMQVRREPGSLSILQRAELNGTVNDFEHHSASPGRSCNIRGRRAVNSTLPR